MTLEDARVKTDSARDLVQLVIEDMEGNFLSDLVPNAVKARAEINLSALYVLHDYLQGVCHAIDAELAKDTHE